MPRFIATSGDFDLTGEWSFEDHGPTSGPNVLILPHGTEVPAITNNDGQIFYVRGSGTLVMTSGGVWKKIQASNFGIEAPDNPLYHWPQSGYADLNGDYPDDNVAIDDWFVSSESSGIRNVIQNTSNQRPTFDNGLGFGAAFFDGSNDWLYQDAAGTSAEGNTDVVTIGAAVRFPDAPNGSQHGIVCLTTSSDAFSIHMNIRTSGVVRSTFHNGTTNYQVFGSTALSGDTNYRLIGVLKSDGTMKVFVNGVDDTFNSTGPFTGTVRASEDLAVGAHNKAGTNPMSGYILDVGIWYRDLEADGELAQLDRYLERRFNSLDGS